MRVIRRVGKVLAYAIPAVVLLVAVVWFVLGNVRDVDTPLVRMTSAAMRPTIAAGDLVVLDNADPGTIAVGDVIAFRRDDDIVVRRVVARDQQGTFFVYRVKGDNRPAVDDAPVTVDDVLGDLDRRLPLLGYGLIAIEDAAGLLALAAIVLLCVAAILGMRIARRRARVTIRAVAAPKALPYGDADPAPAEPPSTRETAMSITPAELRQKRFAQVRKGYDAAAVHSTLERVADSIEELLHERHELVERVRQLEANIERYREVESTLSETLTLAERAANELKAEAQAEAETLMAEARPQLAAAKLAHAAQPTTSAMPDPAFIELLGETRAIRSLLQALLTQSPAEGGDAPFAPRSSEPPT